MDSRLWLDPETMRALGYRVVDHLVERWTGLEHQPIPVTPPRPEVRATLDEPLPRAPSDPERVIDRAVSVLQNAAPTGHPRFFGFIPSPSNFVAVLADALVAGFNPFGGNYVEAPGPHELERRVIRWVTDAIGFPQGASGLFVSGGSMANLTAMVVARQTHRPGVRGRVYVSDQTHGSVAKGLRVLGLDAASVRVVPSDARFQMRVEALREAIREDREAGCTPYCVVATAGTTSTGAVDPLSAIADLASAEGLHLHVDGAYGAAAAFGRDAAASVVGLTRADSVSLDPHKWLFTPYECACLLVRDGASLSRTFATSQTYLEETLSDEPDFQDQGIQLTRSLRALKVWATFQAFGADAIADAIDRGVRHASFLGEVLTARGWELAAPPSLGICAFRHPTLDDADHVAVREALLETGAAMVSGTTLRGARYLRACTLNPRTTEDDLRRLVEGLEDARAQQVS
ncbi:MAG: aspartate aminotransferase family protein [Sandaracinaceae bacterium]